MILFIFKLFKLFNLIDFDDERFVFKDGNFYRSSIFIEWCRFHLSISFFYTGMLILKEPSLSIFLEKLDSQNYGFIEIITLILGIWFGSISLIVYVIKKILDLLQM